MAYPLWYDFFLIGLFISDGIVVWKLLSKVFSFIFGKTLGGCLHALAWFFIGVPLWFGTTGLIMWGLDKIFFGGKS